MVPLKVFIEFEIVAVLEILASDRFDLDIGSAGGFFSVEPEWDVSVTLLRAGFFAVIFVAAFWSFVEYFLKLLRAEGRDGEAVYLN